MSDTYAVRLTQMESLYLSDSISMFSSGPPDALPGEASPYPGLLLKIGGAVLETEQQKADVNVHFSLAELWIIREVTKSSVMVGNERVGMTLLLKTYQGIRSLSAASDMWSVVSVLGEVVDEEPGRNEYAAQLEQLRDGGDLKPGGNIDHGKPEHGGRGGKSRIADESRPDHDATPTA